MAASTSRPGMTSQQRVNAMFERRDHDRVPRYDTYWPETIARWQREGLDGDAETVLGLLGSDICRIGDCRAYPFPGHRKDIRQDELTIDYEDEWGATVRYWKSKSGTPEHLGFGCDSPEAWRRQYKPAYEKLTLDVDADEVRRQHRIGREQGKWNCLSALESFEATRRLMGDEITMIAMAEDPEWVIDVSRTYTNVVLRGLEQHLATGVEPDGLWIFGDMAYRTSTMCSPQMYRDMIWPDHKRLADWGHAHGLKVIFHTDGDVRGVIDLYIEAGFDCLQPLEAKAGMDVRKLCPAHGDRLAFFGNIDVMVMGSNDRQKVEHEVRTKLAAGMATNGYAYHSDHSVPPTCSWATYQLIVDLLNQHGLYG